MIFRILPLLALAACLPPLPEDQTDGDADADADTDTDTDAGTDTDVDPASVDDDGDGYTEIDGDCDDEEPRSYPGNVEVCDDVDNDCDGGVDIGAVDGLTFYADADADGFGDPGSPLVSCTVPAFVVADATDCYDGNSDAYPGSLAQMDVDRGDGSYDYNCDGAESLQWPDLYACEADISYTFGWNGTPVPSCGGWGTLSASLQPWDCVVTFASYPQNCY